MLPIQSSVALLGHKPPSSVFSSCDCPRPGDTQWCGLSRAWARSPWNELHRESITWRPLEQTAPPRLQSRKVPLSAAHFPLPSSGTVAQASQASVLLVCTGVVAVAQWLLPEIG